MYSNMRVCACVVSYREDYRGALSSEEMAVLEELAIIKELSLKALAAREEEIRAIRDGQLKATNKVHACTCS